MVVMSAGVLRKELLADKVVIRDVLAKNLLRLQKIHAALDQCAICSVCKVSRRTAKVVTYVLAVLIPQFTLLNCQLASLAGLHLSYRQIFLPNYQLSYQYIFHPNCQQKLQASFQPIFQLSCLRMSTAR
jgi:hypothetical protein